MEEGAQLTWQAPDPKGVSTALLGDPLKSTLRGKRLRRAFHVPPPLLDAWPAPWRELLGEWVRKASADTRIRFDTLLGRAGATRAHTAQLLLEALLQGGQIEVQERRSAPLGWQPEHLRFLDPARLRQALGLAEPDVARKHWAAQKDATLLRADLDAARARLDGLPPAAALARLELLTALEHWADLGKDRGQATRRDFAYFARGDTKKISDTEWRWLCSELDLTRYGLSDHAPLLLISAPCRLSLPGGELDLGCAHPFLAVPPALLESCSAIRSHPRCWRVVENRSAFEKAAANRHGDDGVLWVPGYPPGWWRAAVSGLLGHAPAPAAIACDPDPDGIAIALQVAACWQQQALSWETWHMAASDLRRLNGRRPLSARDRQLLARLQALAADTPLAELAAAIEQLGEKGEQESLFWQADQGDSRKPTGTHPHQTS